MPSLRTSMASAPTSRISSAGRAMRSVNAADMARRKALITDAMRNLIRVTAKVPPSTMARPGRFRNVRKEALDSIASTTIRTPATSPTRVRISIENPYGMLTLSIAQSGGRDSVVTQFLNDRACGRADAAPDPERFRRLLHQHTKPVMDDLCALFKCPLIEGGDLQGIHHVVDHGSLGNHLR